MEKADEVILTVQQINEAIERGYKEHNKNINLNRCELENEYCHKICQLL